MARFLKKYDVRWSDLDPNRHVANFSYSIFMTDTRISFLREHGFQQQTFEKYKMGPVIFSEEFYYLKEVMPGETVQIDVELLARTEDYKFMKLCHSLFNSKGELAVYSELNSSWFDLVTRKLIVPPEELIRVFEQMPQAERFHMLDKSMLKMSDKVPVGKALQTS